MNKQLFFLIILIISLFNNQVAFAYDDKTTHPALTEQIIEFYNQSSDKKINDEEKEWIIKGSILEDTEPRYINHFYDPIYKEGWTGEHGGFPQSFIQRFSDLAISSERGISTLEWVHNQELQGEYGLYRGNQTWEKALYEYVKTGDREKAFVGLGHVLHLLEDMSVPDHTRNDTHISGSPYESYTTKFTRNSFSTANDLKKQNMQSFKFDTLNEYFETVAEYSNKYFFSKDTINDPKYENPKIIEEKDGWAYGVDENKQNFVLSSVEVLKIKKGSQFQEIKLYSISNVKEYHHLLETYFSHLSREAVLAGFGVVDLFFKEAEKMSKEVASLKAPPENSTKIFSLLGWYKQTENNINSLAQKVGQSFSGFFKKIAGVFYNMPANVITTIEPENEVVELAITEAIPPFVQEEKIPEIKKEIIQKEAISVIEKVESIVEKTILPITTEIKKEIFPPHNIFYGAGSHGGISNEEAPVVPEVVPAPEPVILPSLPEVVALDITAPVITLLGNEFELVPQNSVYTDAGATALDAKDGVREVIMEGEVDTSLLGNYILTFTSTDLSSNTSTKIRTVIVSDGAKLNRPQSVVVSGNYAYVVSEVSNSLEIVDISNSANLIHKGSIVGEAGGAAIFSPKSVAVSGNYAFVVSYANALEVIDITNPNLPVHKATLNNDDGGASLLRPSFITINGNYAYIISSGTGVVEVVDISDPTNPVHKSAYHISTLVAPTSIFISGNYMYLNFLMIGQPYGGFQIIDISDPSHLVLKSNIEGNTSDGFYSRSLFVVGNYAYITGWDSKSLEVMDVSDPTNPIHVGRLVDGFGNGTSFTPNYIYISGNYAYITSFVGETFEVVDISNPVLPIHIASLANGDGGASINYPSSVFVSGNYAYISSSTGNALEVIDISNPLLPIHKNKLLNGEFSRSDPPPSPPSPPSPPVAPSVPDPVVDPAPLVTNPSITSYTFNGIADNITINPLTNPVTLVLNSNENVNWMSIKIEKEDDAHVYKNFQSGVNCVDGTNVCTKVWNGLLSGGGLLQNGVYKIKVHIKDVALNEFYDYLLPYKITVNIPEEI